MPYRLLVKTHHITSKAKIQRLTRAAEQLHVSVLIKTTVKPFGMMICEGDSENSAREWLSIVKRMRYKGFSFVTGEESPGGRVINRGRNGVTCVNGTDEFNLELDRLSMGISGSSIKEWWKTAMGFERQ